MYRYFLIPYAGGSTATFNSWKNKMSSKVDLQVVELAGHGKRIFEDFYQTIPEACGDIYETLKNKYEQDGMDYYLGGHCLGAVIAVELVYLIRERKEFPLPKAIVISGHGSVKYTRQKEKLAEKTQEELTEILKKEGGLSEESMQPEILELLIPVIQADAALYESYQFDESRGKLPVDLTVMYAENDLKSPMNEVKDWLDIAEKKVTYIPFETDHYFILHEQEKYIEIIRNMQ